ncbi:saccharopine dehydrogenase NADP-binding domain-containing protein [Nocardia huaxiensis]|uniref:Saccharopine dehydrogenase NADP-binding domain-containing protein n=1 Tax=Nocardia huaxiensis TaxID=2755382 RepID=A0A7D6VLY8_9NOCA|nr:saccharopine dehydrogenase NADP-binding domain-containing protein [Nocardia huaxiensis]QLY32610.1 saccharopine dehydrogenase NADP-binding domain-containing protein [Nocardia huaxiensis]
MKIAVYGASGHVGRFAVDELRGRGIDVVVVGRNAERLNGFEAEVRVAAADDHEALVAAFTGIDVVISTLPDFTGTGEGVVRAAIAAGAHYVDVAGEQLFVKKIFDEYGPLAENAGVTLAPAITEAGIFGDLLANLGAARLGGADEIVLSHLAAPGGEGSRGSMRTVLRNLEVFTSGGLSWIDGEFRTGPQPQRDTFLPPAAPEPIAVMKFPQPSVVTIPRHTTAASIEGVLAKSIFEIVGTVTESDLANAPETPGAPAAYSMVTDIYRDGRHLRGIGSGPDAYRNSAQLAVETAVRIAAGAGKPGAQSPAELFDPVEFLDALGEFGITWTLGEVR